jgi:hypothetical protein
METGPELMVAIKRYAKDFTAKSWRCQTNPT